MKTYRSSSGKLFQVSGIRALEDLSSFEVLNRDAVESLLVTVKNPLGFPSADFEIANYSVALFTHSEWPESEVLSLKYRDESIGLLFAMQALSSDQTVLPANYNWNNYGFIALQKICLGEYEYGPSEFVIPEPTPVFASSLFADDTIVIILDRNACMSKMSEEEFAILIDICLPSIAQYGFYPLDHESSPGNFRANALAMPGQRTNLTLRSTSPKFPEDAITFFKEIILSSAQREQNPAFRLFLCYQMIEILMAKVYDQLIQNFSVKAGLTNNASKLRDLNEELMSEISEKKRISRIFNSNNSGPSQVLMTRLKTKCDVLLCAIDPTQAATKNAETALYLVRNRVFHSFATVGHLSCELEEVAQALFVFLCELTVDYQVPK